MPMDEVTTHTEAVAGAPLGGRDVEDELDRLSLEQALRDFEVANARAADLTERLIGVTKELAEAREELARVRADHEELQLRHERMQSSAAFRLATRIWDIRNALRR